MHFKIKEWVEESSKPNPVSKNFLKKPFSLINTIKLINVINKIKPISKILTFEPKIKAKFISQGKLITVLRSFLIQSKMTPNL